ncbi:hypothetical protein OOK39_43300 [Streptomyces sp. NBC_00264]|uniref:hypothetical protein n=1 Tax=unclassified Streptomyces TaxID=2593676 RepID=UPI000F5BD50A|nr:MULTISPECIES: hypothetical protein [unclassified Streptomyces]WSG48630.1 hypothetical protein OHA38_01745 [Streptomyces sp. NBC_01732]WSW99279.1 hypothetical protein OG355_01850 [Streptomyces sp. NBC_00987]MCX4399273.1 hypothetical protein [Streptomyces sp. NBC_01767]MCX5165468.1 hypothetical protein [Streptomyces sp. NBC_00305]MCX5166122.1 hypothetical protein [Streptomyces sp. NBC_00305]
MAFLDVSKIDRRVRNEVKQRGLFLVSPDEDEVDVFVFVCTDPNPKDCGFTRVGQVVGTGTSGNFCHPYVMDGVDTEPAVSLTMLRGIFASWEDGIKAVLVAYDEWH